MLCLGLSAESKMLEHGAVILCSISSFNRNENGESSEIFGVGSFYESIRRRNASGFCGLHRDRRRRDAMMRYA